MPDKHSFDQLRPYMAAGYIIIPLRKWDSVNKETKQLDGKVPLQNRWQHIDHSLEEKAIRDYLAIKHNMGIRLCADDLVIDVDPRNMRGVDNFAKLCADFRLDFTGYPTVETGSGGLHIFMKKPPGDIIREMMKAYPGLEFKTKGRQVVAAGSLHPDTGRIYKWQGDGIGDGVIPPVPENLLDALRRVNVVRNSKGVEGARYNGAELAEMLSHLDATKFCKENEYGYSWTRMMMACHDATAGAGIDAFIQWSVSDPEYADMEFEIAARWESRSLKWDGKITYRTLHYYMHQEKVGDKILKPDTGSVFEEFPDEVRRFNEGRPEHERVDPLEYFNTRYFAVRMGSSFRIGCEDGHDDGCVFMREEDFNRWLRHVTHVVKDGDKRRELQTSRAWLGWKKRRMYSQVVFKPRGDTEDYEYNMFRGWAVDPEPGDWSALDFLLKEVLCENEAAYEYVLNWCAFMVKKPWILPGVALAFHGNKGTGKSTLGKMLCKLAGQHGQQITSSVHLTGKFNAHLQDCLFLFADEAIRPRENMAQSVLKGLITESEIKIERKGVDVISAPNVMHLMLASNDEWFIPAGPSDGERRFFVSRANDNLRGNFKFFAKLYESMERGGLAGFLHDMLRRDIDGWEPWANIPNTDSLVAQKMHGWAAVQEWWCEKLQLGNIGLVASNPNYANWATGPLRVFQKELRDDYARYANEDRVTSQRFNRGLEKVCPRVVRDNLFDDARDFPHIATSGTTHRAAAYQFPSLLDCRRVFAESVGSDYDYMFKDDAFACHIAYDRYLDKLGESAGAELLRNYSVDGPRDVDETRRAKFIAEARKAC